ncbi:MAG: PAC2 family protein [Acidimicrobiaceae bacterium]|nr:PAC2 family protein [Acidimicrobiaceae bacterium]
MDNDYIIFLDEPELHEPILVYALEGWIDAGLGAQSALSNLLSQVESDVLAKFDTEYFIDQRARRPTVRITDGVTTELVWPEIELRVGRDRDGADLLILVGPEPDFHWSDFVEALTDTAEHFGVRLVVGLGAFPAPTPHTRPTRVVATAPADSEHLLPLVGTVEGDLEVPAGISAAIELGCADVEIDVLTLWARVPHYVASMTYPQAAAALVDTLARIGGLSLDSSSLQSAADETRLRVDELVTNNPEHAAMVEHLESIADEHEGTSFGDPVPEPEELSAELDRFLRGEGF